MRRWIWLVLAVLVGPQLALAQAPQVHWSSYEYVVAVQPSGDLQFTETQTLVVDSGTLRRGTLKFNTGTAGRVRSIAVSEDNEAYQRSSGGAPGTFEGSDSGTQASITYYFRDPTRTSHTLQISYIVSQALRDSGGRAALAWNFFCSGTCPRADQASVTVEFPQTVASAALEATATGLASRRSSTSRSVRFEATGAATGTQLRLALAFPASVVPGATLLSGAAQPSQPQTNTQPSGAAAPSSSPSSSLLCVLVIFFMIFVFSVRRQTGRRPIRPGGPRSDGPLYGRRRRGGMWGGGFGGWGGGYGGGGYGGGYGGDLLGRDPRDQPDTASGGESFGDSSSGGMSFGDSDSGGMSFGDSDSGGLKLRRLRQRRRQLQRLRRQLWQLRRRGRRRLQRRRGRQ